MLDVRRLALLRELSLRGTITAVAAALHQTPSSVSQQLAHLEKEAGVPLLLKAGRRLQLTPAASLLVEHTTGILEQLERADADLAASLSSASGILRVAIFQSVALALLPRALDVLERDHPGLTAIVTQREPETALHETYARDFDLVIAEEYPGHAAPRLAGLDRRPLTTDALRLAIPPGGRFPATTIADVADAPWVMEPHGAASRHWAEQACRRAGFEPKVRFETADLQAHVQLIRTGHAVALLPDLIWQGTAPTVDLVPLDGDPRRTIFTATRMTIAERPSVVAFRHALEAAASELDRDTGG
ncbi:LysR family transcriptional regulator [Pseudolysinimonas sp.]|jgi:DNA-binding transcriptional LysR family regulator|uniref:LysR family transcriptional regulator n=1 Tax=Pseudolysinimonas sp. TaxID=2680009 RepID=UPI003782F77C